MNPNLTLFVSLFTTLLAIINPFEAVPVFLNLLRGKDAAEHRRVARQSCLYALALMFFFMLFGTLMLHLFGVPLSMVQVVGGIILTRIGFQLFEGPAWQKSSHSSNTAAANEDVAFVPMAMPIMFGPGGIATIITMSAAMKHSGNETESIAVSSLAIVATMGIMYLALAYAAKILKKIGPRGLDAATRIVGFFVSAMGMGLVFKGVVEFLQSYGLLLGPVTGS